MVPERIWWWSCQAYKRRMPLIARRSKALNFFAFKAILPCEAHIYPDIRLEQYGLGVVIHPNVEIGRRVKIYHQVTLAAESPVGSEHKIIVDDDVTFGARDMARLGLDYEGDLSPINCTICKTRRPLMSPPHDKLSDLYSSADRVRVAFNGDAQQAARYFQNYLGFVTRSAPCQDGMRLLDIGCGSGWSSYLFARRGYQTTGIDLNESAFEPPPAEGLSLRQASVLEMPFTDASFNVVTAYQTIEHIPDPRRALLEMLRVCKPGGTVCIVGPNLVSLGQSLRGLYFACRNRPLSRVFLRAAGMPRHPYGNTLPETLASIPLTLGRIIAKSLASRAFFTMRDPDLTPPFHADNDACYLCNPIDLSKFLSRHGCQVVQVGAYGRPRWTASLAGGTWMAARKRPGR